MQQENQTTHDVYLIDGTFELFRAYYSAPSKKIDGVEVGATNGFLRNIWSLLKKQPQAKFACAFDHVIESFRNEIFQGYKTGEGIDPELQQQFPLVEEAATALGMKIWPMIPFEADDAIATAAHQLEGLKNVRRIIICSPDKDFAQCVRGTHIICWDRIRNKWIDEVAVKKKFGIYPASIPDWLALVGDSADGIPGIPKWGAKSASTFLANYHHIEHFPKKVHEITFNIRGGQSLLASLREHEKDVFLYRKLATLRKDAPIECSLTDLTWNGPDLTLLRKLDTKIKIHPRLTSELVSFRCDL